MAYLISTADQVAKLEEVAVQRAAAHRQELAAVRRAYETATMAAAAQSRTRGGVGSSRKAGAITDLGAKRDDAVPRWLPESALGRQLDDMTTAQWLTLVDPDDETGDVGYDQLNASTCI